MAGGRTQTRQPKLAVLGFRRKLRVRYDHRSDRAQSSDNFACIVEPAHLRVAGGKSAIRLRVGQILLDREKQLRNGLIEAPTEEMCGAYPDEHWADAGARAEAQRCFAMLDRDVGLTRP